MTKSEIKKKIVKSFLFETSFLDSNKKIFIEKFLKWFGFLVIKKVIKNKEIGKDIKNMYLKVSFRL